jgi:hypothetical protein
MPMHASGISAGKVESPEGNRGQSTISLDHSKQRQLSPLLALWLLWTAGQTGRRTSARRLLDLLGEACSTQSPSTVGRGAERVDDAAFERGPRNSARYAL